MLNEHNQYFYTINRNTNVKQQVVKNVLQGKIGLKIKFSL